MNLRRHLAWAGVVLAVATIAESSVVTKRSLLSPLLSDHCFTCKADEKPITWSLMQYFTKFKDAVVRAVNSVADKVRHRRNCLD